ncbi:PAS domain-containing protein [Lachnospiraceae bacterium NSJ-143]|nr:PAS domain-containing protein [Lachnospiraceae bacterium NSJ-143]
MALNSTIYIDQMTEVLDNAPVAVIVSSIESHKLLYANSLAVKSITYSEMNTDSSNQYMCYHAAGFNEPCKFCHIDNLSSSKLLVREYQHPINGKHYQLSGKIINWAGTPAHIEYILDITEAYNEKNRSNSLRRKLTETFSNIPCGLCVYQFDGKRIVPLFHNSAFYDIMGYSAEHIKMVEQETTYLSVHPEDVDTLKNKIRYSLENSCTIQHTYRVLNDLYGEYRWIHMEGSVKSHKDGNKLLFCVYSDVNEQMSLESELKSAKEKIQNIINAIPGGVAIYRITDKIETVYFSDGVPELSGHTVEEYNELIKRDVSEVIYYQDKQMVLSKVKKVIENHQISKFEFRKQHKDGHVVWIRIQIKYIGEDCGYPLLHCVFHNISDIKEAQLEMDHLINSIPGGIASYRVEGGKFVPTYFSDGVMSLSGHTREEFNELAGEDAMNIIYEADRERVIKAAKEAIENSTVLDISYRMRHKDGNLIWIHLNGRRMDPMSEVIRFYAVFTGMSAETRMFQSLANETADGIYVIEKDNYDILYANESKELFDKKTVRTGEKCYKVLYGKDAPCDFCPIKNGSKAQDGKEYEMSFGMDKFYNARFRETDWNGIPAYVKYIRDVTEEVKIQNEKARLEQYFQTVVKHLPGGVAVVRYEKDGCMTPEFLSDGFAEMTGMSVDEAWKLYCKDAMAGVHPEDMNRVNQQMSKFISSGENQCEIVYRLKTGNDGYIWVKNTLSIIQSDRGEIRIYAGYNDVTKEREEQERIRKQYNELIMQHYHTPGPDALVIGHCNVTQNKILEIIDYTDSDLLKMFGTDRHEFFSGIASLIVDKDEQEAFKGAYLNEPSLAAFERGETEIIQKCFIKMPKDKLGHYAQFKVILVETPDTGDVTGILTVTDITEQTISEKILYRLSVDSYDLVLDVDLLKDEYTVLTFGKDSHDIPDLHGCHSEHIEYMLTNQVLSKDREHAAKMLNPDYIIEHLKEDGAYSFSYSIMGECGDVLTKTLTILATDIRLGRICLARTDITDSVREQQGLLHVIAYTFELLAFININAERLTLYTRKTVLENLSPFIVEGYDNSVEKLSEYYFSNNDNDEEQFSLNVILKRLEEKPEGYDFVLPYYSNDGLRYKQINVLWGDRDHKTVCMVRADVTDMLSEERRTKIALEKALSFAEEANRAKSDFLSSMSHDIRTPMNAIMGMTALAQAHIGEQARVKDCLNKISLSSKHLLSLINDILDMSKIERSKITLNCMKISISELMDQMSAIMGPQAKESGLIFSVEERNITNRYFYGDYLRITQICINILGNAVKFTPEGGKISFLVEQIPSVKGANHARYRFAVKDTGIGMSEDFISHIFEPFTRNHKSERVEGTGLGLSITKGLVDLMGGEISVESRINKGTTFCFELECRIADNDKLQTTENSNEENTEADEQMLAGRNFLVAEDNAINSEILCEILLMYGATSDVRTDGRKALQAFVDSEPGTYDAVLMDIKMPNMNGYEATRAIRELNRADAKTIPIIAMTANAFAEDIQESLEAGMTAHIAKPIDINILGDTLKRLLSVKNRK